jgi:hypothetical protein
MRGILILLAALCILAGEPAVAAPSPPPETGPALDLKSLLYQWEQRAAARSSSHGR